LLVSPCAVLGDYRAWPSFECLGGSNGAILDDPRDKRKAVHRESQSIFPPAYRKELIGVWYYNLRSPLKPTSPCHPRDIGARPQYKERRWFFS
jgi:hypothetical protein